MIERRDAHAEMITVRSEGDVGRCQGAIAAPKQRDDVSRWQVPLRHSDMSVDDATQRPCSSAVETASQHHGRGLSRDKQRARLRVGPRRRRVQRADGRQVDPLCGGQVVERRDHDCGGSSEARRRAIAGILIDALRSHVRRYAEEHDARRGSLRTDLRGGISDDSSVNDLYASHGAWLSTAK